MEKNYQITELSNETEKLKLKNRNNPRKIAEISRIISKLNIISPIEN